MCFTGKYFVYVFDLLSEKMIVVSYVAAVYADRILNFALVISQFCGELSLMLIMENEGFQFIYPSISVITSSWH